MFTVGTSIEFIGRAGLFTNEAILFLSASSYRDGKISREEMIDYFMKASSLLNCKMGFIHTFTETTYVKPTFCEHCAGFVSKDIIMFYAFA